MPPLLSLRGITRRFPGVLALDDVSLDLRGGEVLALVGENGAGKSTLVHVLAGAQPPDAGAILLDGAPLRLASPADALRAGIGVMYQDTRLVPGLSVAENILLGHEPVRGPVALLRKREMRATAAAALARLGNRVDPGRPAHTLGPADAQLVAMARALTHRLTILALDEPTAPLTGREAEHLFTVVRRLADDGAAVLVISHRLEEVFRLADRIAVLRDGRLVHTGPARNLDRPRLIALMVGRTMDREFPPPTAVPGDELLRIEGVSARGLHDVSLTLRRGEVLGVAGLAGSGRTTLAHAIFGALPRSGGRMVLSGRAYDPATPADGIAAGVALLTEDRNRTGLFLNMNLRENISIASLARFRRGPFLRAAEERTAAGALRDALRIRAPGVDTPVTSLSGGNRQKAVLARWLLRDADVLLFDEPTAGVDVGARYELYREIDRLAAAGRGIMVFSSDLSELLGICRTIAVLREGRVRGILPAADATSERLIDLATSAGAAA